MDDQAYERALETTLFWTPAATIQRLERAEQLRNGPPPHELCYRHHCQEFDKLPNCQRHLAANWITGDPANCELCR